MNCPICNIELPIEKREHEIQIDNDNIDKVDQATMCSEAWLLMGLFNSQSLPGVLNYEQGRLIFYATDMGTFWDSGLKKLEQKTGVKNLMLDMKQGKVVELFNVGLKDIQKNRDNTCLLIFWIGKFKIFYYHKLI